MFIHEQSLLLVFTKALPVNLSMKEDTRKTCSSLSSVRLQGAEGVTFGNEDTSNRTNESESANLPNIALSAHQRWLSIRVTSDCVRTQTNEAITAAVEIVSRVRSAVQVKRFFTFIQHETTPSEGTGLAASCKCASNCTYNSLDAVAFRTKQVKQIKQQKPRTHAAQQFKMLAACSMVPTCRVKTCEIEVQEGCAVIDRNV